MFEQPSQPNPFDRPPAPGREKRRPKFERILTEADRGHAERGLQALKNLFESSSAEEFPDAIVFMDTGARPLAAGVLPIARAISEQRGLPMPENRFLAGGFRNFFLDEVHAAQESGDPAWKETFVEKMLDRGGKYGPKTPQEEAETRAYWEEVIRQDEASAQALKERLTDILEDTKAKHVLIVDDYLSQGLTLKQVHRVLQSMDKELRPQVTFMSFFAKEEWLPYDEDLDVQPPNPLLAEAAVQRWLDEGFRVVLPTREASDYAGFVYGHKPDFAKAEDEAKAKLKKSFIGVEKIPGQVFSKVAAERDQELMLQLRHEMRGIADEILKK